MSTDSKETLTAFEDEPRYSLEVLAEMTGLGIQTLVHYQEEGFIKSVSDAFGQDDLRTVRRLEVLRESCGVNNHGLKLLHHLIQEVERLKSELQSLK